ncbi:C2 family cysteine protease [Frankia sp. QA3]|uniref:C2 family cysteine protease n=1 Tax=Frankia sp. QA3 TaxID=710111 RepID=UPI000269C6AF|nr:C2 family cysteine protease [Frankia sp. QA3]EIV95170.1 Calpain family cysteine protease [Frankia sp. QA3]
MREGPAPTGGAVVSAGPADDLCHHAAALRRLAMGVAAVLTGVRTADAGSSPLRARLDGRVLAWRSALDADAEALWARAALLDRLAAGWVLPARPPWPAAAVSPRSPSSRVSSGSPAPAEAPVAGVGAAAVRFDPVLTGVLAARLRATADRAAALGRAVAAAVGEADRAMARVGGTGAPGPVRMGGSAGRGLRLVAVEAPDAAADIELRMARFAAAPITLRRANPIDPLERVGWTPGARPASPAVLAVAAGLLALFDSAPDVPGVERLRATRARLAALPAPARAGVIGLLRGGRLTVLAAMAARLAGTPKPGAVLAAAELAGLADDLLAGAPTDMLGELVRVLPWLEPAAPLPAGGERSGPVLGVDRSGDAIVRDGADPGDVGQGGVPDCYLAAVLIGLARQDPALLAERLRRNPNGTVTITFHPGSGAPVGVTVTATLSASRVPAPVPPGGGEGRGVAVQEIAMDGDNAAGRPELWPALYEKAYARLHGGYPAIGFGSAAVALRTLTGRPVSRRAARARSVVDLAALLGRGEVVVLTTRARTGPGGLVAAHAYPVLAVDAARGRVLLRNPWDPPPGEDNVRWYAWSQVVADVHAVVHGPTR